MRGQLVSQLLKDLAGAMGPTPEGVHVPTPQWPKGRGRKRRVAQILAKLASDPGLYVARQLTPECDAQLRAWWASNPKRGALDANLHVTIVHSEVSVPWVPEQNEVTVPRSNFLGFAAIGDKRAIALRFRAPALQSRWKAARRDGATWDYPAYNPHITLVYAPAGHPPFPPLPPFDLVFGPEEAGSLQQDIFKLGPEAVLSDPALLEDLAEAVHDSWMQHQEDAGDEHMLAYAGLDEKAKQVDRDAVRAVLEGMVRAGYGLVPVSEVTRPR